MSAQGALFVSVGWYHHHVGLNVRNSRGASKRPFPQFGLGTMTLQLATSNDLERLSKRLSTNNISFEQKNWTITVQDPWGNMLKFTN
jgi:catechol 2,3-dioxygenase